MGQLAQVQTERLEALSTLLRYAEIEAREMHEVHLAEEIRKVYLSMDSGMLPGTGGFVVSGTKKMRS
ncbi:MAG: hypothetical protein AAGL24_01660 [Pseudomonadota bacterium]